jgi:beta-galactosidase
MNAPYKRILCIIALFSIFTATRAQTEEKFFPPKNLMQLGVYYYPEQWPKEEWARDIKHIAELGFEFIHLGEFAWANMEPQAGVFDFNWLDACIAEAAKNKLKVILCTPTAAPPVWLTRLHPEVLLINAQGITQQHGSRLHANPSGPIFQFYAKRITGQLAARYGHDARIWGWQLDNEPHLGTLYDYSPTALSGFHSWLMARYPSIALLNQAWGTAFWSESYSSFDQIRIPNSNEAPQGVNPHALLDFQRYTSDALAGSIRSIADTLHKAIARSQFITTNFAYYRFIPPVDPFRSKDDLNFASHTMYLMNTISDEDRGELGFRLGSGLELSFSADLSRSVSGYTGIMELQPGQINWGKWNSQPLPGAVRMWVWHAFGLGEKFTCTYRYRQPLFGNEMYHNGIMETDGTSLSRGGSEFIQALQEIQELRKFYNPESKIPHELTSSKTAFLWSTDNLLDLENQKQTQAWDSWKHYLTYYACLKSMGANVQFITENNYPDPNEFPFMVIPACQRTDAALIAKWEEYVRAGGQLILSCRTGQKDKLGHFPETQLQHQIQSLIGARVEYFDQLPPGKSGIVKTDTSRYSWNAWADILEPDDGTEVLATYGDQFYAGKAAVVSRKLGKGTVTYLGCWSSNDALEKEILRKIWIKGGASILDLPAYVFTDWRDGFWVTVNYSSRPAHAPVGKKARILIGNETVNPGGVCVWTVD